RGDGGASGARATRRSWPPLPRLAARSRQQRQVRPKPPQLALRAQPRAQVVAEQPPDRARRVPVLKVELRHSRPPDHDRELGRRAGPGGGRPRPLPARNHARRSVPTSRRIAPAGSRSSRSNSAIPVRQTMTVNSAAAPPTTVSYTVYGSSSASPARSRTRRNTSSNRD